VCRNPVVDSLRCIAPLGLDIPCGVALSARAVERRLFGRNCTLKFLDRLDALGILGTILRWSTYSQGRLRLHLAAP
jgi:hypothetical protein